MKRLNKTGFTAIELLVCVLGVIVLAGIGVANVRSLRADNRDEARKTDINAIYFQLESFYEKNNYYPEKLSAETLKGIDPESLVDQDELAVNADGGSYTYRPKDCSKTQCQSFELSTELERETTYVKLSLNN